MTLSAADLKRARELAAAAPPPGAELLGRLRAILAGAEPVQLPPGIGAATGALAAIPAPRAFAGEPCPNGCTEGHGRDKRPELIVRINPDPEHPDYGELSCPACWGYMGNDQRSAGRGPEREAG
jgi:hypothetical protein